MLLLAADTATPFESVALVEAGPDGRRLLGSRLALHRRGHGPSLLDALEGLLTEAGRRLDEVGGLVCGLGPGSFTGLRISLASLKGLAMARDLPLFGVPTWRALVAALPDHPVAAVIDAGRGEVYVAAEPESGLIQPEADPVKIGRPALVKPDQITTVLCADQPMTLLGSGALRYRAEWSQWLPHAQAPAAEGLHVPRAALLAEVADLTQPADVATLEPQYVRRSDAEIHYPDGFPDALRHQA